MSAVAPPVGSPSTSPPGIMIVRIQNKSPFISKPPFGHTAAGGIAALGSPEIARLGYLSAGCSAPKWREAGASRRIGATVLRHSEKTGGRLHL